MYIDLGHVFMSFSQFYHLEILVQFLKKNTHTQNAL